MVLLLVLVLLSVSPTTVAMDGCPDGNQYRCGDICMYYDGGTCDCGGETLGKEDVDIVQCCSVLS